MSEQLLARGAQASAARLVWGIICLIPGGFILVCWLMILFGYAQPWFEYFLPSLWAGIGVLGGLITGVGIVLVALSKYDYYLAFYQISLLTKDSRLSKTPFGV